MPAFCEFGVPVFPDAVPGAAVSPGMSNCSLTNPAGLTVIEALVPGVLVPSEISVAVTVREPEVLNVRLKLFVPETRDALAGNVAFGSVDVIPTTSDALVITFQLESTALTITDNGEFTV